MHTQIFFAAFCFGEAPFPLDNSWGLVKIFQMKAISVRQPHAWLIVMGIKDVENRTWPTKYRGRILIHASKHKLTKAEYEWVEQAYARVGKKAPSREEFLTGGIIGSVEITDCVTKYKGTFFSGPYGFVLKRPKKLPFKPMNGKLGIFEV